MQSGSAEANSSMCWQGLGGRGGTRGEAWGKPSAPLPLPAAGRCGGHAAYKRLPCSSRHRFPKESSLGMPRCCSVSGGTGYTKRPEHSGLGESPHVGPFWCIGSFPTFGIPFSTCLQLRSPWEHHTAWCHVLVHGRAAAWASCGRNQQRLSAVSTPSWSFCLLIKLCSAVK